MTRFCVIGTLFLALWIPALPVLAIDGADWSGTADSVGRADFGSVSQAYKTARATQCCNCCYGGFVPSGSERTCVVTTPDRCRRRGWVCYGYVLCP